MERPALGIPIIIIAIFLIMTGYVSFVMNGTKQQPEAPPEPPVVNMQTPAAVSPERGQSPGGSAGLSRSAIPAGEEVKSWTGRFAGHVDNNLMVIYVGDEAKTFLTPPGFAGAGLTRGDNVSFDFFHDQNGQPVLSAITKLVPSE